MADDLSQPVHGETPIFSFPPVVKAGARILILGSMPGLASLKANQYYAHSRNAFWPVMESLFGISRALPYPDRCLQLTEHGLALWDVMQACVRPGSLDSSIDDATVVPNDFGSFLETYSTIEKICFNGTKAFEAYRQHVLPSLDEAQQCIPRVQLPSTSPAHASMNLEKKIECWKVHLLQE